MTAIIKENIKKSLGLSLPQRAVAKAKKSRNLFMAGIGSGKSHVAAPIAVYYIKQHPQIRGFIGANTYSQLSKSTLSRIMTVWADEFDLIRDRDYVVDRQPPAHWPVFGSRLKKYDNTISFDNGCLIMLASLDNYASIDGIEIGWALLDETKDTKEIAVKEVITTRLRQPGMYVSGGGVYNQSTYDEYLRDGQFVVQKHPNDEGELVDVVWNVIKDCEVTGFNPMYIFTSPAKVDWLNEWFGINENITEIMAKIFSKTDFYYNEQSNYSVTISSTYHNQHNLSHGFIENLIESYAHNKQLVDVLVYGCPVAKSGGEWFSRFDRMKHVKRLDLDEDLAIHLSIDENVVPYMTMLVSQFVEVDDKIHWRILQEYCLPNPKNNAESLATEFVIDYAGKVNGLYYTGDATSRRRSTLRRGNEHIYDVIDEVLEGYLNNNSRKLLKKNPSLAKCRDFFNRMLAGGYEHIVVEIDESCVNLIADMEFLKEDSRGAYKKQKVTNPQTGETYEKHGHCADAWRYLGVISFPDEWYKM